MALFPEPAPSASSSSGSNWVLAHCDGGSRGNPGPAGYGAVVADEGGRVLAELSEFLGIRTNNFAEYSGLLAVLQYALEHGHRRLRVVSDSELMVKQIQGKYKVNSPDLKPLWAEARARIGRLEKFEISHALRHKNKQADALANAAMDKGMGRKPRPAEDAPVESLPLRPVRREPVAGGPGGDSGVRALRSASAAEPPIVRAEPYPQRPAAPADPFAGNRAPSSPVQTKSVSGAMHRGFVRDGVVHLLGGATLPDGVFVKIIQE